MKANDSLITIQMLLAVLVPGNAEGALGDWESARQHFEAAAADPEMESIAKVGSGAVQCIDAHWS